MAIDSWTLTDDTKIAEYGLTLRIKHGRDVLAIDMGRDDAEARRNVDRIRVALDQIIVELGGE